MIRARPGPGGQCMRERRMEVRKKPLGFDLFSDMSFKNKRRDLSVYNVHNQPSLYSSFLFFFNFDI